ncbi:MAG: T9SS type A sorting domain-containing protein [Bacteroidetes bacterium]|nr:T9SS type A sorting domain-containing protein [Bacteroidota bacterium]
MKKLLLNSAFLFFTFGVKAQTCSDLFISKYVSMGANNKCLELYNPSPNPIVMNGKYYLARYKTPTVSGNTSGPVPSFPSFSDTVWLKGRVPAFGTWVVCNPETVPSPSNNNAICDPLLRAHADQVGNIYGTYGSGVGDPTYFKGSDAITLEKKVGSTVTIVDLFGRFTDYMASSTGTPSAWSTVAPYTGGTGMGVWITKGYMMERKPTVLMGVTANPSAFNPLAEYDTITKPQVYQDTIDAWNKLGNHICNCPGAGVNEIENPSNISIYPNPVAEFLNIMIISNDIITHVAVYDIEGKLIAEKNVLSNIKKTEITTGILPAGIYVVKINYRNGKLGVTRFIKN